MSDDLARWICEAMNWGGTLPSTRPLVTGPPHRFCQFIAGEPSANPDYCGEPVVPGQSWCPEHNARVWGRARNISDEIREARRLRFKLMVAQGILRAGPAWTGGKARKKKAKAA